MHDYGVNPDLKVDPVLFPWVWLPYGSKYAVAMLTEDGFKGLLAMDSHTKIRDRTAYPAVLLTHGINDPRVEPSQSAKMAARLQAATASGKPVWLRIEYDAGHGFGTTRSQSNEEQAYTYAFLFHQLLAPNAGAGRDTGEAR